MYNFEMKSPDKDWFILQELSGKNSEMHAEVGKAKLEMAQRIQKLEAERNSQSELYDKIAKLERQLSGEFVFYFILSIIIGSANTNVISV